MGSIDYVCFDIGGVLGMVDTGAALALGQERWGDHFSRETLRRLVHAKTGEKDYWRELQNGDLSVSDFLSLSLPLAGLPSTAEDQRHALRCLQKWGGNPYQPMVALAQSLRLSGYHTSILSNNNAIMFNRTWCEMIVDVALSSHEIRVSKPDVRAYEILLENLGTPSPASVLFIDDKIRNVEAARQLGMAGFCFRSRDVTMDTAFGELESSLTQLGVRYR